MQGAACVPFSTNHNVFQLTNSTKEQLAELPAILDSFYTNITNDHIGMVVESHEGVGFSVCRS